MILVFIFALGVTKAQAAEHYRYFETAGGDGKIEILESDKYALFKWTGAVYPDSGKVFMFEKRNERDFYPRGSHITPLVFLDRGRETLYKGSIHKAWQLSGMANSNDLEFIELTGHEDGGAKLKREYAASEGLEPKMTQATVKAESVSELAKACDFKGSVDMTDFDQASRPPAGKAKSAASGVADICSDPDYKRAVGVFRKISFVATASGDVAVEKKSSNLVIKIPAGSENTRYQVSGLLKQSL